MDPIVKCLDTFNACEPETSERFAALIALVQTVSSFIGVHSTFSDSDHFDAVSACAFIPPHVGRSFPSPFRGLVATSVQSLVFNFATYIRSSSDLPAVGESPNEVSAPMILKSLLSALQQVAPLVGAVTARSLVRMATPSTRSRPAPQPPTYRHHIRHLSALSSSALTFCTALQAPSVPRASRAVTQLLQAVDAAVGALPSARPPTPAVSYTSGLAPTVEGEAALASTICAAVNVAARASVAIASVSPLRPRGGGCEGKGQSEGGFESVRSSLWDAVTLCKTKEPSSTTTEDAATAADGGGGGGVGVPTGVDEGPLPCAPPACDVCGERCGRVVSALSALTFLETRRKDRRRKVPEEGSEDVGMASGDGWMGLWTPSVVVTRSVSRAQSCDAAAPRVRGVAGEGTCVSLSQQSTSVSYTFTAPPCVVDCGLEVLGVKGVTQSASRGGADARCALGDMGGGRGADGMGGVVRALDAIDDRCTVVGALFRIFFAAEAAGVAVHAADAVSVLWCCFLFGTSSKEVVRRLVQDEGAVEDARGGGTREGSGSGAESVPEALDLHNDDVPVQLALSVAASVGQTTGLLLTLFDSQFSPNGVRPGEPAGTGSKGGYSVAQLAAEAPAVDFAAADVRFQLTSLAAVHSPHRHDVVARGLHPLPTPAEVLCGTYVALWGCTVAPSVPHSPIDSHSPDALVPSPPSTGVTDAHVKALSIKTVLADALARSLPDLCGVCVDGDLHCRTAHRSSLSSLSTTSSPMNPCSTAPPRAAHGLVCLRAAGSIFANASRASFSACGSSSPASSVVRGTDGAVSIAGGPPTTVVSSKCTFDLDVGMTWSVREALLRSADASPKGLMRSSTVSSTRWPKATPCGSCRRLYMTVPSTLSVVAARVAAEGTAQLCSALQKALTISLHNRQLLSLFHSAHRIHARAVAITAAAAAAVQGVVSVPGTVAATATTAGGVVLGGVAQQERLSLMPCEPSRLPIQTPSLSTLSPSGGGASLALPERGMGGVLVRNTRQLHCATGHGAALPSFPDVVFAAHSGDSTPHGGICACRGRSSTTHLPLPYDQGTLGGLRPCGVLLAYCDAPSYTAALPGPLAVLCCDFIYEGLGRADSSSGRALSAPSSASADSTQASHTGRCCGEGAVFLLQTLQSAVRSLLSLPGISHSSIAAVGGGCACVCSAPVPLSEGIPSLSSSASLPMSAIASYAIASLVAVGCAVPASSAAHGAASAALLVLSLCDDARLRRDAARALAVITPHPPTTSIHPQPLDAVGGGSGLSQGVVSSSPQATQTSPGRHTYASTPTAPHGSTSTGAFAGGEGGSDDAPLKPPALPSVSAAALLEGVGDTSAATRLRRCAMAFYSTHPDAMMYALSTPAAAPACAMLAAAAGVTTFDAFAEPLLGTQLLPLALLSRDARCVKVVVEAAIAAGRRAMGMVDGRGAFVGESVATPHGAPFGSPDVLSSSPSFSQKFSQSVSRPDAASAAHSYAITLLLPHVDRLLAFLLLRSVVATAPHGDLSLFNASPSQTPSFGVCAHTLLSAFHLLLGVLSGKVDRCGDNVADPAAHFSKLGVGVQPSAACRGRTLSDPLPCSKPADCSGLRGGGDVVTRDAEAFLPNRKTATPSPMEMERDAPEGVAPSVASSRTHSHTIMHPALAGRVVHSACSAIVHLLVEMRDVIAASLSVAVTAQLTGTAAVASAFAQRRFVQFAAARGGVLVAVLGASDGVAVADPPPTAHQHGGRGHGAVGDTVQAGVTDSADPFFPPVVLADCASAYATTSSPLAVAAFGSSALATVPGSVAHARNCWVASTAAVTLAAAVTEASSGSPDSSMPPTATDPPPSKRKGGAKPPQQSSTTPTGQVNSTHIQECVPPRSSQSSYHYGPRAEPLRVEVSRSSGSNRTLREPSKAGPSCVTSSRTAATPSVHRGRVSSPQSRRRTQGVRLSVSSTSTSSSDSTSSGSDVSSSTASNGSEEASPKAGSGAALDSAIVGAWDTSGGGAGALSAQLWGGGAPVCAPACGVFAGVALFTDTALDNSASRSGLRQRVWCGGHARVVRRPSRASPFSSGPMEAKDGRRKGGTSPPAKRAARGGVVDADVERSGDRLDSVRPQCVEQDTVVEVVGFRIAAPTLPPFALQAFQHDAFTLLWGVRPPRQYRQVRPPSASAASAALFSSFGGSSLSDGGARPRVVPGAAHTSRLPSVGISGCDGGAEGRAVSPLLSSSGSIFSAAAHRMASVSAEVGWCSRSLATALVVYGSVIGGAWPIAAHSLGECLAASLVPAKFGFEAPLACGVSAIPIVAGVVTSMHRGYHPLPRADDSGVGGGGASVGVDAGKTKSLLQCADDAASPTPSSTRRSQQQRSRAGGASQRARSVAGGKRGASSGGGGDDSTSPQRRHKPEKGVPGTGGEGVDVSFNEDCVIPDISRGRVGQNPATSPRGSTTSCPVCGRVDSRQCLCTCASLPQAVDGVGRAAEAHREGHSRTSRWGARERLHAVAALRALLATAAYAASLPIITDYVHQSETVRFLLSPSSSRDSVFPAGTPHPEVHLSRGTASGRCYEGGHITPSSLIPASRLWLGVLATMATTRLSLSTPCVAVALHVAATVCDGLKGAPFPVRRALPPLFRDVVRCLRPSFASSALACPFAREGPSGGCEGVRCGTVAHVLGGVSRGSLRSVFDYDAAAPAISQRSEVGVGVAGGALRVNTQGDVVPASDGSEAGDDDAHGGASLVQHPSSAGDGRSLGNRRGGSGGGRRGRQQSTSVSPSTNHRRSGQRESRLSARGGVRDQLVVSRAAAADEADEAAVAAICSVDSAVHTGRVALRLYGGCGVAFCDVIRRGVAGLCCVLGGGPPGTLDPADACAVVDCGPTSPRRRSSDGLNTLLLPPPSGGGKDSRGCGVVVEDRGWEGSVASASLPSTSSDADGDGSGMVQGVPSSSCPRSGGVRGGGGGGVTSGGSTSVPASSRIPQPVPFDIFSDGGLQGRGGDGPRSPPAPHAIAARGCAVSSSEWGTAMTGGTAARRVSATGGRAQSRSTHVEANGGSARVSGSPHAKALVAVSGNDFAARVRLLARRVARICGRGGVVTNVDGCGRQMQNALSAVRVLPPPSLMSHARLMLLVALSVDLSQMWEYVPSLPVGVLAAARALSVASLATPIREVRAAAAAVLGHVGVQTGAVADGRGAVKAKPQDTTTTRQFNAAGGTATSVGPSVGAGGGVRAGHAADEGGVERDFPVPVSTLALVLLRVVAEVLRQPDASYYAAVYAARLLVGKSEQFALSVTSDDDVSGGAVGDKAGTRGVGGASRVSKTDAGSIANPQSSAASDVAVGRPTKWMTSPLWRQLSPTEQATLSVILTPSTDLTLTRRRPVTRKRIYQRAIPPLLWARTLCDQMIRLVTHTHAQLLGGGGPGGERNVERTVKPVKRARSGASVGGTSRGVRGGAAGSEQVSDDGKSEDVSSAGRASRSASRRGTSTKKRSASTTTKESGAAKGRASFAPLADLLSAVHPLLSQSHDVNTVLLPHIVCATAVVLHRSRKAVERGSRSDSPPHGADGGVAVSTMVHPFAVECSSIFADAHAPSAPPLVQLALDCVATLQRWCNHAHLSVKANADASKAPSPPPSRTQSPATSPPAFTDEGLYGTAAERAQAIEEEVLDQISARSMASAAHAIGAHSRAAFYRESAIRTAAPLQSVRAAEAVRVEPLAAVRAGELFLCCASRSGSKVPRNDKELTVSDGAKLLSLSATRVSLPLSDPHGYAVMNAWRDADEAADSLIHVHMIPGGVHRVWIVSDSDAVSLSNAFSSLGDRSGSDGCRGMMLTRNVVGGSLGGERLVDDASSRPPAGNGVTLTFGGGDADSFGGASEDVSDARGLSILQSADISAGLSFSAAFLAMKERPSGLSGAHAAPVASARGGAALALSRLGLDTCAMLVGHDALCTPSSAGGWVGDTGLDMGSGAQCDSALRATVLSSAVRLGEWGRVGQLLTGYTACWPDGGAANSHVGDVHRVTAAEAVAVSVAPHIEAPVHLNRTSPFPIIGDDVGWDVAEDTVSDAAAAAQLALAVSSGGGFAVAMLAGVAAGGPARGASALDAALSASSETTSDNAAGEAVWSDSASSRFSLLEMLCCGLHATTDLSLAVHVLGMPVAYGDLSRACPPEAQAAKSRLLGTLASRAAKDPHLQLFDTHEQIVRQWGLGPSAAAYVTLARAQCAIRDRNLPLAHAALRRARLDAASNLSTTVASRCSPTAIADATSLLLRVVASQAQVHILSSDFAAAERCGADALRATGMAVCLTPSTGPLSTSVSTMLFDRSHDAPADVLAAAADVQLQVISAASCAGRLGSDDLITAIQSVLAAGPRVDVGGTCECCGAAHLSDDDEATDAAEESDGCGDMSRRSGRRSMPVDAATDVTDDDDVVEVVPNARAGALGGGAADAKMARGVAAAATPARTALDAPTAPTTLREGAGNAGGSLAGRPAAASRFLERLPLSLHSAASSVPPPCHCIALRCGLARRADAFDIARLRLAACLDDSLNASREALYGSANDALDLLILGGSTERPASVPVKVARFLADRVPDVVTAYAVPLVQGVGVLRALPRVITLCLLVAAVAHDMSVSAEQMDRRADHGGGGGAPLARCVAASGHRLTAQGPDDAALDHLKDMTEASDAVHQTLRYVLENMPVTTLYAAASHLAAHLGHRDPRFADLVVDGLARAMRAFPHQCTWLLLSHLATSDRAPNPTGSAMATRHINAREVMKRADTLQNPSLQELQSLCHGLRSLAALNLPKGVHTLTSADAGRYPEFSTFCSSVNQIRRGVMRPARDVLDRPRFAVMPFTTIGADTAGRTSPTNPPPDTSGGGGRRAARAARTAGSAPSFELPPEDVIITIRTRVAIMASLQAPKRLMTVDGAGRTHSFLLKTDDLRRDHRVTEIASVLNTVFAHGGGSAVPQEVQYAARSCGTVAHGSLSRRCADGRGGAHVGVEEVTRGDAASLQLVGERERMALLCLDGGVRGSSGAPSIDPHCDLRIRTFAAVPLRSTPKSSSGRGSVAASYGLIEWVPKMATLQSLVGPTPPWLQRIGAIAQADDRKGWLGSELRAVSRAQPPTLGRWFFDQFNSPPAWIAARSRFARTCSVMSMVGSVLGLGDRHAANVLIDTSRGDVMHVDFECLFDKAMNLKIPERVPCRITPNVVDACGVSGLDGTFTDAATASLTALRAAADAVWAHLEAFVADPLVDLSAEPARAAARQLHDEAGLAAERKAHANVTYRGQGTAVDVRAVRGRLLGRVCGSDGGAVLQPAAQAVGWIKDASNIENLSKMYVWWMPWL